MSSRKKISKVFDDIVLNKAKFDYNTSSNIGKLVVEYQSGLEYHYKNVDILSVKMLFEHDEKYAFTAHNKWIESKFRDKKIVKTPKWEKTIDIARQKQYKAKNNEARRARKQKAREEKQSYGVR